jgi:peptidoglycan/xylan/chitin deacetylase (PgdA/CDA1 family)
MRKDLALIRSRIERTLRLLRARNEYRIHKWKYSIESHKNISGGIILVYHRVNRLPKSGFRPTRDMSVYTDDFDKQLQFLKKHFSIVRLEHVIDCLQKSNELPRNFAVITFDDGYEDNFTEAYPLLKKHKIPATIFLTTGLIDNGKLLWHDQLEMLLSHTACKTLFLKNQKNITNLSLRTPGGKSFAYEFLTEFCLSLIPREREQFLKQLAGLLNVNVNIKMAQHYKLLNWEQVRTIKSNGLVDFGSHTTSHQVVTQIEESILKNELEEPQKLLMQKTGVRTKLFAYPNGNFDKKLRNYLEFCRYQGACTIEPALVNNYCDPYFIPRIGVTGMPLEGLVQKISFTMEMRK